MDLLHFGLNLKFKIFKSKILFSFRHASPEAQYWCHQSQSWSGVAFITFWSGVKNPDFFDFFKHFFSRHQECVFQENATYLVIYRRFSFFIFFRSWYLLSWAQYCWNRFQICTGVGPVIFWSAVKIPDFFDLVLIFFQLAWNHNQNSCFKNFEFEI